MYHNLSKIRPRVMNLSGTSKRRVGVFSRVVIFLSKNTPTSRAVSLALVMYACSDSAMPLLSFTCLCNNSKLCLPPFVSPSSCKVLLRWCFLLNCMYCSINGWAYFREKSTLCNNFIHKRGGGYFREITVNVILHFEDDAITKISQAKAPKDAMHLHLYNVKCATLHGSIDTKEFSIYISFTTRTKASRYGN